MLEKSDLGELRTLSRAMALLRLLGAAGPEGMRLSELADATRLHKTTAHRILAALAQEGMIRREGTRRYTLGPEAWILGVAAARQFDIKALGRPALERISAQTDDVAFLQIRSGTEALCIDRVDGSFSIRPMSLQIGGRRPLGVGAGSLALLAALEDPEIERIISANEHALHDYPRFTPGHLRFKIDETRRQGFSFIGGDVVPEMCAVGVPIRDHAGAPIAALSCAAIGSRMQDERRAQLADLIKREAAAIAAQLMPKKRQRPDPSDASRGGSSAVSTFTEHTPRHQS